MALVSMRQLLDHAAENNYGVPAFNVNNLEQVQAIMEAASKTSSPVIMQASAGARKYAGEPFLRHLILAAIEQYPDIHQFMTDTIENAREKGYTETIAGRRRYFKDIKSGNASIRANAERAAINSPIQGTAADMIKLAMVKIHELMQGRKSRMILQVHDELLFDLHQDEHDELPPLILEAMESAISLPNEVPIKIDLGFGDNWLQAH